MPKRKANNEVEQPQDKKKQKLSERSVNIPMVCEIFLSNNL